MLRRFSEACRAHPDRDALCIEARRTTYAELAARVEGLRAWLEGAVGDDETAIGVLARDDVLVYAAILATAFSGRAFVPIHPDAPEERNREIIRQSGLRTLVAGAGDAAASGLASGAVRILDASAVAPSSTPLVAPEADPHDLAYLLFTSGSTGTPKGVPITHGNLSAFIDALQEVCPVDATDRVLQMFDLTFDFSIATYLAPLCRGACVHPVPPGSFRFNAIADLLVAQRLTVAPMVPSVLSYLRPYFDEIRLPELRHSYFCGEALRRELLLEWARCVPNARITNFYGPTEATVFSLFYRWDPAAGCDKSVADVVALGRPMQGMHALVVDARGRPVPAGEPGELCLAGAQVTPGYWRAPERSEEAFLPSDPLGRGLRWYRTGDLAREDEDGDFFFLGRVDDQVQIQGYRVELGEIENAARRLVAPAEAAAVAVEGEHGTLEIHLFVARPELDARDLRRRLADVLPRYMVPQRVVALAALPLNPNGKVDRRALRSRARGSNGTG